MRVVVQSEKKPEHLENRVEAFLDEMKTKLEGMSEEEFASHRSGLQKKWLEANKNLAEEVSKYLVFINNGQWDFLRSEYRTLNLELEANGYAIDQKDADLLQTITKAELLHLFFARVHPSSQTRAKLSVHMLSKKPRPKQVSAAAAEAFETLLRQELPELDVKAWKSSITSNNPTVVEFGQYWLKNLKLETAQKLLVQLPGIVAQHPIEGDAADQKRMNATYIEDTDAFRASLKVSEYPGPMVEWNDLPTPRF